MTHYKKPTSVKNLTHAQTRKRTAFYRGHANYSPRTAVWSVDASEPAGDSFLYSIKEGLITSLPTLANADDWKFRSYSTVGITVTCLQTM